MPYNFSSDLYDSIIEASVRGELWGIESSDLTPLEIWFYLVTLVNKHKNRVVSNYGKLFTIGIDAKLSIMAILFRIISWIFFWPLRSLLIHS